MKLGHSRMNQGIIFGFSYILPKIKSGHASDSIPGMANTTLFVNVSVCGHCVQVPGGRLAGNGRGWHKNLGFKEWLQGLWWKYCVTGGKNGSIINSEYHPQWTNNLNILSLCNSDLCHQMVWFMVYWLVSSTKPLHKYATVNWADKMKFNVRFSISHMNGMWNESGPKWTNGLLCIVIWYQGPVSI